MTCRRRPYRDASDIARMKRVVGAAFALVPSHPLGGIEWVVFGPHGFPPQDIVSLWERSDGEIVAWAILSSADAFDYRIVPELCGTSLEGELVDWGLDGILAWRRVNGLDARCIVECWGGDTSRADILAERGFETKGVTGVVFSRSLDAVIPSSLVPDGWTVGSLRDQLVDSRARTQFEAFAPGSRTTPETWRYLMANAPGYDRDLDNVAVSPEGEVCAAALVWLDDNCGAGEFEPVGTRPEFQRRGLGKAVLYRGLTKMKERGMTTAIVGTNASNAAAIALYESVGFRIINRLTEYEYTPGPSAGR
jgi:ribosomal protein S18 acetylase RimI-like enzyme